jgi:hypothetical protein
MRGLDGEAVNAYTHNGDRELMRSLGLRTTGFGREWTELGTTVVVPAADARPGEEKQFPARPAHTVKVEVSAFPAMFWRFTIFRTVEEVVEDGDGSAGSEWHTVLHPETIELCTGSGGFYTYWPTAEAIARNHMSIRPVEPERGGVSV